MTRDALFLPVLVQIALTAYAYLRLGAAKKAASRAGSVDEARRALHEDAWPDHVIQINHAIRNQFELPVLFYVLCLMLWALDAASIAAQALAWLFALSRIAHFVEHTGANRVAQRRRPLFTVGAVAVLGLLVLAKLALLGRLLG
ncbi:MAG: MAPEG family protein [Xanthomonadales bacterium]|nr:MAPEG family protein [Xanthomonadales bacterium]